MERVIQASKTQIPERVIQASKTQTPLIKKGQLGRFRQVFPLTLFPDELIIEQNRVVWNVNKGPWVRELITTMATDIASLDSSTGPFFGHIHIKSLTGGPDILLDRLFKSDVIKARYLVEGIVITSRKGELLQNQNLESAREFYINVGRVN